MQFWAAWDYTVEYFLSEQMSVQKKQQYWERGAVDSFPAGSLCNPGAVNVENSSYIPGMPAARTETKLPCSQKRKESNAFSSLKSFKLKLSRLGILQSEIKSVLRKVFSWWLPDSSTWNMSIQRAVFSNSPDSWQTCTQKGEKWKSR